MSKNIDQVYIANPITSNASTDLMYFGQSPYGAGNDAAMTYANFSAQFGTPYTAAALTRTNDTNVTLTLGGTPATALLQATSLTLGWTGQLSLTRGGTNNNLTANNGGILWSDATKLNILSGTATANLPLLSGSTATPSWGAFALSLGGALTTAGAVTTSGAFGATFTFTNTTSVTFPTAGTLATTSQLPTPAALTSGNDTNVTLTLGGTPTTALLQAASITAGWTGQLSLTRGGSNASLTASAGGVVYSTASAMAFSAVGSSGQLFISQGTSAPIWTTSTYPTTNAANTILYASSANTMAALATANDGILITSNTGVPSWLANGTAGYILTANSGAPPSWSAVTTIGAVTTVNGNSGSATPSSGVLTISGGTTGLTTSGTSSTLSLTGTLAVANGGTGITSFGTGVATALGQNVTGSGGIVLATSPTMVTPTLGAASATSINFGGSTLSTYTTATTWTPTFTFGTPGNLSVSYATQAGFYSRIGNIVTLTFQMTFTPTFTTSSGNAIFGGLPFTSNANGGNTSTFCPLTVSIAFPASTTCLAGYLPPNSSTYLIYGTTATGTVSPLTSVQFTTGVQATVYGQITYLV